MTYWYITDINGDPVGLVPGDLSQPPDSVLIEEDDPLVDFFKLGDAKEKKITEIKSEGLARIKSVIPGLDSFDAVELMRELWLSINPAAQAPTSDMQLIIGIYQAGRDAITLVRAFSTVAEVDAFDPAAHPAWP